MLARASLRSHRLTVLPFAFADLYGKYEEYDQVPLGIQAVVAAIYEPPQSSEPDGVELLDDPNAETIDRLYAQIGLEKVRARSPRRPPLLPCS